MATAAGTTLGSRGSPNCAASRTRVARKRFPPASIRSADVASSKSCCARAASSKPSSTRARPSTTSAARAASDSSTGTTVITASPINQPGAAGTAPAGPLPGIHHDKRSTAPGENGHASRCGRRPASAHEKLRGRVMSKAQQRLRREAEHQRREHPDADRQRGERAGPDHGRTVGDRLTEEHEHDNARVGEGKNGAAQDADDHQGQRPARDGGLEYGELPVEPAGQRDAGGGDEEESEDPGDQRGPPAKPCPPGQVASLAAG